MKPMLARTYGPRYSQWPCYCQPKLNGVRVLNQYGAFQSRGEKLWKHTFFPHIVEQIIALDLGPLILDGEFYVHGWRLQRINSAVGVNNNEPNTDTPNIIFHVFDVVNPDQSFSRRWFEVYHQILTAQLSNIQAVPTALLSNAGDMQMHFNAYTAQGYEGIMLRPDGPYEYGEHDARSGPARKTSYRSTNLWKHKQWEDDEFICHSVTAGEGKAEIGIGALVLQVHDYPEGGTFKVGTGFTNEERIFFAKNPPIGKYVRVRYLELTANSIPFNPSFLAVMD